MDICYEKTVASDHVKGTTGSSFDIANRVLCGFSRLFQRSNPANAPLPAVTSQPMRTVELASSSEGTIVTLLVALGALQMSHTTFKPKNNTMRRAHLPHACVRMVG